MGLTVDTLKKSFPRTSKALENYGMLIDRYTMPDSPGRTALRTGALTLLAVAVEEAAELRQNIQAVRGAMGSLATLLKRRPGA